MDIYRKNVKPQNNILYFALYISMFPQLIAGPIVRYIDIEEQLVKRRISAVRLGQGAMFFIRGLAKKVILANMTGEIFEQISAVSASRLSVLAAWLGCISYAFQIYFDFSGYSDMAVGLGKMFGFEFRKNFDYPYISQSISEFWRRWHISLSTWFREYVYIPLGGNRCSAARNIINLMIVWTLTGMWHGAAWNFIAWGLYYGVLLVMEKYVWGSGCRPASEGGTAYLCAGSCDDRLGILFQPQHRVCTPLSRRDVRRGSGARGTAEPGLLFCLTGCSICLQCSDLQKRDMPCSEQ